MCQSRYRQGVTPARAGAAPDAGISGAARSLYRPLMRGSRLALIICAFWTVGCVTVHHDGTFTWGWDPLEIEEDATLLERFKAQIERHDSDAMRTFWQQSVNALHGDDIGRLARMSDTVSWVAERASWIPGVHDYADWLNSRQEYFEAARQAREVEQLRRRQAAARQRARQQQLQQPTGGDPPATTPPPIVGLPQDPVLYLPHLPATAFSRRPAPARPTGKPAAPARKKAETGREYWQKKVAQKPAPGGSEAVLPVARKAFAEAKLPLELVWIAEVESTMNPAARSPAGAVGLFQLMPRTAESLGLSLKPQDQRLDPAANSAAAARYLRQLYRRFDSWPLTLAAYNAGQGRVGTLIRRHGNSFDAIAAHLPVETRLYVPRVLETIRARSGTDPETLPAPR